MRSILKLQSNRFHAIKNVNILINIISPIYIYINSSLWSKFQHVSLHLMFRHRQCLLKVLSILGPFYYDNKTI